MDLTSFDALNRVKQLNAVPKELAESLGLNIAPGTPAHNHAAESKKQWRSPAVEDVSARTSILCTRAGGTHATCQFVCTTNHT